KSILILDRNKLTRLL
ncbi:MAG: hypothetical protein GW818_09380, partial [Flavobacteriales bacterium]|nr:hypothetical protein [Flavobacteriales bacterium]